MCNAHFTFAHCTLHILHIAHFAHCTLHILHIPHFVHCTFCTFCTLRLIKKGLCWYLTFPLKSHSNCFLLRSETHFDFQNSHYHHGEGALGPVNDACLSLMFCNVHPMFIIIVVMLRKGAPVNDACLLSNVLQRSLNVYHHHCGGDDKRRWTPLDQWMTHVCPPMFSYTCCCFSSIFTLFTSIIIKI